MREYESRKIHGNQVIVSLIIVYIPYKMIYNNIYYNYIIITYNDLYIQNIYVCMCVCVYMDIKLCGMHYPFNTQIFSEPYYVPSLFWCLDA